MWLSRALVLIGALNWGLIGLFRFDLVAAIFGGPASWLSRIIYSLVGFAGLFELIALSTRRPATTGDRH